MGKRIPNGVRDVVDFLVYRIGDLHRISPYVMRYGRKLEKQHSLGTNSDSVM